MTGLFSWTHNLLEFGHSKYFQVCFEYAQCFQHWYDTIRYDTRCYFNVRSKADISRLNLPDTHSLITSSLLSWVELTAKRAGVKPTGPLWIINKKLSYRRVTARCVLSVVILPIATQQCRKYLYDKFWPNRWYEVGGLVRRNVSLTMCTQPWRDRVAFIVSDVINKPTTVELCISPVYRRHAVA